VQIRAVIFEENVKTA